MRVCDRGNEVRAINKGKAEGMSVACRNFIQIPSYADFHFPQKQTDGNRIQNTSL